MRATCATLVFGAILGSAALAHAETGVYDTTPWDTAPPCADSAGASLPLEIPANVPGLPVHKTAGAVVRLLGPDGTELSRDVVARGSLQVLLVPSPLTEGATYTVAWTADCGSSSVKFVAGAKRPLPTTAGTLVVDEPIFSEPVSKYRCDAAHRPIGTTTTPVRFVPSPELVPFLGVTDVDPFVDGGSDGGWPRVGEFLTSGQRLAMPSLACPAPSVFRRVAARVTVAGLEPLDTPEVVVGLRCPAAVSAERCMSDTPTDAGIGMGATDSGLSGTPDPSSDAGCQTAGSAGFGLFAWLAVGGVSLTVARATRRRR